MSLLASARPLAVALLALALPACRAAEPVPLSGAAATAGAIRVPVRSPELLELLPADAELVFVVEPDGSVRDPRVLSSTHPAFDAVALEALRGMRFEPGERAGEPVPMRLRATVTFTAGQSL